MGILSHSLFSHLISVWSGNRDREKIAIALIIHSLDPSHNRGTTSSIGIGYRTQWLTWHSAGVQELGLFLSIDMPPLRGGESRSGGDLCGNAIAVIIHSLDPTKGARNRGLEGISIAVIIHSFDPSHNRGTTLLGLDTVPNVSHGTPLECRNWDFSFLLTCRPSGAGSRDLEEISIAVIIHSFDLLQPSNIS